MKPYRKPHYRDTAERDFILSLCWAMFVGGLIGATVTLVAISI